MGSEPLGPLNFKSWTLEQVKASSNLVGVIMEELASSGVVLPNSQRIEPLITEKTGVFPWLLASLYLSGKRIVSVRPENIINVKAGVRILFRDSIISSPNNLAKGVEDLQFTIHNKGRRDQGQERINYFSFNKHRSSKTYSLLYFEQMPSTLFTSTPFDYSAFLRQPGYLNVDASDPEGIALHLRLSQYQLFAPYNRPFLDYLRVRTKLIVQDDSGWPFKDLRTHFGQIAMFGDYSGPAKLLLQNVDAVKDIMQSDLVTALKNMSSSLRPLPISVSYRYHWNFNQNGERSATSATTKMHSNQCGGMENRGCNEHHLGSSKHDIEHETMSTPQGDCYYEPYLQHTEKPATETYSSNLRNDEHLGSDLVVDGSVSSTGQLLIVAKHSNV